MQKLLLLLPIISNSFKICINQIQVCSVGDPYLEFFEYNQITNNYELEYTTSWQGSTNIATYEEDQHCKSYNTLEKFRVRIWDSNFFSDTLYCSLNLNENNNLNNGVYIERCSSTCNVVKYTISEVVPNTPSPTISSQGDILKCTIKDRAFLSSDRYKIYDSLFEEDTPEECWRKCWNEYSNCKYAEYDYFWEGCELYSDYEDTLSVSDYDIFVVNRQFASCDLDNDLEDAGRAIGIGIIIVIGISVCCCLTIIIAGLKYFCCK